MEDAAGPPPATDKQSKQPKQQLNTQQHKGCSSTVQPKLAARRPDWELPQLHAGLELASLEPLHATKRSTCPKWSVIATLNALEDCHQHRPVPCSVSRHVR